jgi:hypothetical protein
MTIASLSSGCAATAPSASKAAATWRGEYATAIKTLIADGVLTGGHGVYTGSVELKYTKIRNSVRTILR